MADEIRISVVVATFNRRDELLRLLSSMESSLVRPDVEVHVLDDGSTDGTGDALKEIARRLSDRFRYTVLDHGGPAPARNFGILEARGDVVVFVDTDCEVPEDWLDALTAPLLEEDGIGATGGPDRAMETDSPLARSIDYLMTAFLTTGGVRGSVKKAGTYHPRTFNMAVRRDAAIAAGGFPNIWYGEDILFSHRVKKNGFRLQFVEKAWLYHRRRITALGWARQIFRMGRARLLMGRYDRALLEPVYLVPLAEWTLAFAATFALALIPASRPIVTALAGLFGLYLVAIAGDAARRTGLTGSALRVPLLFILREASYAAGSVAGLFASTKPLAENDSLGAASSDTNSDSVY